MTKRYTVFYNNKSGKSKAWRVWKDHLEKRFEGGENVTLMTADQLCPRAIESEIRMIKLLRWNTDHILVLGGDGTINSLVNFMINNNCVTPFSAIPCGTGNGLCKSFLFSKNEDYGIDEAIDSALYGENTKLDIFRMRLCNDKFEKSIRYGFLSLTWGMFANIDLKTEWLRCCGSFRNKLGALWELIMKSNYYGTLIYQSEDGKTRKKVEGYFYYFTASNVSHLCHDVFVRPDSKLDDGHICISYLTGNVSRFTLLRMLLSLEKGGCMKYLTNIRTKNFTLVPLRGTMMLDGEKIKAQSIHMEIDDTQNVVIT